MSDKEIVFSQSIKAGKRIYYLDVKKNRKDEMFLAITESKKIVTGEGDESQVSFEKHKIFLYKEDFEKFMNGLQQAIGFIQEQQGCFMRRNDNEEQPDNVQPAEEQKEKDSPLDGEIKIDIDEKKEENIESYINAEEIDEDTDILTEETLITVYWTPKGKSYHMSSTCRTLSRSKVINSGTLQECDRQYACEHCK